MSAKHRSASSQERRALAALQAAFPLAFPADPAQIRPLAIGICQTLFAWIRDRPDLTEIGIKRALSQHCGRDRYQRALVAGAMRIDLDGREVTPVTPDAQVRAEATLARARAARQRKASEKAAQLERHRAAEATRQAAAQTKRAAAKPKVVQPAPAPAPRPVVATKAAPAVVVKKRRVAVPPAI